MSTYLCFFYHLFIVMYVVNPVIQLFKTISYFLRKLREEKSPVFYI